MQFLPAHGLRAMVFAFSAWTLSMAPASAEAQTVRLQMMPLPSKTLTDEQMLSGGAEKAPSTLLAAQLRIPVPGTRKFPAIVLLHGSGGISGNVDEWGARFASMGIATLSVDSFTGRGIASTVTDQEQLGRLSAVYDAYRALEVLARHPAIDAERIAVMGFSRGAQSAVYSAMERLYHKHGPTGNLKFAAHIGLYTPCGTTYIDDVMVSHRPIRMFHGTADDYVPAAPCEKYTQRLRESGNDAEFTSYAGAQHVYDWPLLQTPFRLADAQVTGGCALREREPGKIVEEATQSAFRTTHPCVKRGATVAYNAQAHAATVQELQHFVSRTLLGEK
ncbi:MAG: dienelactone hydrolase family protein [Burkholderiaceae bacterium]|nr:dienelactone hydrolase family protein [Burkholderiaceae bacterium]